MNPIIELLLLFISGTGNVKELVKIDSSQKHWVSLACTAGAPVYFHAVPTSYERDYVVMGEYMNKGDRNVRCFSQFKNSYGKVWAELIFFQASY